MPINFDNETKLRRTALLLIPGDLAEPGIGRSAKEGLEAIGAEVRQENPNMVRPHEITKADIIVCNGTRGGMPDVIEAYNKIGKNVIVMDLGYFGSRADNYKNPRGYYQFSLNKLGWIPEKGTEVPDDRLKQLDIEIPKNRPRPEGFEKKIVLVGQKPNDAQHRLTKGELQNQLEEAAAKIRKYTNKPLVFREHPKSRESMSISGVETENAGSSEEVLKRSYAVVTHNSTMGIEAIQWGVPVISLGAKDGKCFYSDLCEDQIENIDNPYVPSYEERYDFFKRLAYAQWNRDEIEQGKPFEFLIKYMNQEPIVVSSSSDEDGKDEEPEPEEVISHATNADLQREEQGPIRDQGTGEIPTDSSEQSSPGEYEAATESLSTSEAPEQLTLPADFYEMRFFTQKKEVEQVTGEKVRNKQDMNRLIESYGLEPEGE